MSIIAFQVTCHLIFNSFNEPLNYSNHLFMVFYYNYSDSLYFNYCI